MTTPDKLITEHGQELENFDRRTAAESEAIQERQRLEQIAVADFQGFIDRWELADYLGVSMPRVSVLITSGRIREGKFGCSLGDATKYRDNRKPGRPKGNRRFY